MLNTELLRKHISVYSAQLKKEPEKDSEELKERKERISYYQSWSRERILAMTETDLYEYVSKLWAMLIWGNKHYVVDKLMSNHGLESVKKELAELIWGKKSLELRWDRFRDKIKGIGPAMMSEILCHVYPTECMIWNRRAYVGLNYLGFENLPRYNYQVTGKKYLQLSNDAKVLVQEFEKAKIADATLLSVDYFLWDELQVEQNLSQLSYQSNTKESGSQEPEPATSSEFIHDEVRDKIAEIGQWLGFESGVEIKVAKGSKVDAIWEATIGNMGRVIYVFEVQTKGSIDSLLMNLIKSRHNPAVQGIIAVSDSKQLEKIRDQASTVPDLAQNLKYWNYEEVLQNHEALEAVNESINRLGLVPQGF